MKNVIGNICVIKSISKKDLLGKFTSEIEFMATFRLDKLKDLKENRYSKPTSSSVVFSNLIDKIDNITKEDFLNEVFKILAKERVFPKDMLCICEACGSAEDFLIDMLILKEITAPNGIIDSRYIVQFRYKDIKEEKELDQVVKKDSIGDSIKLINRFIV